MTNLSEIQPSASPAAQLVTLTEIMTPEKAQALLDKMGQQRPVRRNKVETLKRLIANGRWKLLPHGIVLDPNGVMLDGQHRMWAIVETARALPVRVTYNCDPELYRYIDSVQSPRTIDDVLRHGGVSPTIATAAAMAVRFLFRADLGMSPFHSGLQPSNDEALETYSKHLLLPEAAEMAVRCRGVAPSRGVLAYVLYLGLGADAARTRAFAVALATGESLKSGDPALLLRNTWFRERSARVGRDLSDVATQSAAALNRHLRRKPMHSWRGVEFGKGKMPPVGR